MNNAIEYLEYLMKAKSKQKVAENYFSWLYLFTNENISGFYKKLDFKDKEVLSVTGSGDHILNAYLHGAKSVDAFDINPLAKYFSELKIAAVKSLTKEEFLLFFNNNTGLFKTSKYFFNESFYKNKIRNNLKKEYRFFWDYLFEKYTSKEIKKSFLFTDDKLSFEGIIDVNDYLKNDENYYKLREILFKKYVNYYDIDLKEVVNINKKYQLVILSNIASYLDQMFNDQHLKRFREIIEKLKSDDTKIVVSYLYYGCIKNVDNQSPIYLKEQVEKFFDNKDFEYIGFDSVEIYETPRLFGREDREDNILVSK